MTTSPEKPTTTEIEVQAAEVDIPMMYHTAERSYSFHSDTELSVWYGGQEVDTIALDGRSPEDAIAKYQSEIGIPQAD